MFKWNLINKTNKQEKITRDIEIKNKLTLTRGEWEGIMGDKGEGFSEACTKDTWTKPKRGRIKGENWGWLEWGQNGDNCT